MTEEEIERRKRRKERHRQERERQRQRQKEAERMKSAMNYLADPRKRLGRDYEQWQAGQVVQTPEAQQKLTILRRIDDGHAGVVFKVRDDEGNILALKVPRKESEKQFKKLHQEVAKNARMQSLGLEVADITEEGGDYLVKRWIDGLRGDHWFIQWNEKGRPLDDIAWRRLCEMFDMLAAKNIYVQNLKDLNMIWDGQKWVVIDVGYFKVGLTPQQALGRYYETFDGRWNKPRYNRGRFMFLCPTIAALRGHSHPQHYIKRETTRDYYRKKSKTSTGDNSAEAPIPAQGAAMGFGAGADGRKAGTGAGLPTGGGTNAVSSEALNDIKRKQAEAAMAVLERAKNRKKKKKRLAAAAEGEAKDDATTATTAPPSPSREAKNEEERKKEEKSEAKNKKRSTKEEEAKDKRDKESELKAKKDKEAKDKKERESELKAKKDKDLKDKKEKEQRDKEQKEKDKKEKEQQKKKK